MVPDVAASGGESDAVIPLIPKIGAVLIPKGRGKDIECRIDLAADVQAPVEKGQTLGTAAFFLDGEALGEYRFTSPEAVPALSFSTVFLRILRSTANLKK